MKFKIKFLNIAWLALAFSFAGCAKKLEEVYQNPNAPVKVPVETLLPGMIGSFVGSSSAAGSAYGLAGDGIIIGRYIQYWGANAVSATANGATQYDRMGGATAASDNLGSMWAAHYYGMGQNLNRMVDWATEEQKWDYVGVGYAMRAWSMLTATNQYNNMVLRQAFNTSLQTFNYEDQPEIYDSVRVTCFRALDYLNMTGGNVSQQNLAIGDAYLNNGDVNLWKKFVYGILARSYAYLSAKQSYNADSVIKYADLSATTNAENITAKFANTGVTGTMNYMGPIRGNVGALRQSKFVADLMSGLNSGAFTGVSDPRAIYILRENTNGTFKGVIPGQSAANSGIPTAADQPQNFWGNSFALSTSPAVDAARYIYRNEAEFPLMTATEMKFLKAEAALRKNDNATALAAYTEGIGLNFDMLTSKYAINIPAGREITPATKADYLNNPAVVPETPDQLTFTHIMLQKYIALYGWGMQETWVDMRRYHYTDADPSTGSQVYAGFEPPLSNLFENNNGKLVYRTRPRYNSEYLYNIPALESIGALDIDYHTKMPWFAMP
ncbi:MAG: SusD/RagB family nutrient-binding outer membrane lipoprotein [Flavitalea sp.]